MSLLHPRSRGFAAGWETTASPFPHDPTDERAWSGGGPVYQTASGLTVDYPTALRVSCIFQGVRLIGQTIGSMPIRAQQDLGDGRRPEVRDHYVRRLFMKRPNSWQTPKQFRETLTAWSILWGQGIAEIKSGPSGPFDELWPIQPEWVTTEQIKSTKKLRFVIDEPGEARRVLLQDEVFRIDGFGLSNAMGASVLKLAREAIGLWVSHEKFQGLYFGQGAKPSVWLQHPDKLAPDAYLRLKNNVQEKYGGWHNHHKVALVEQGIQVKETGFNARDSQMNETRRELVEEMARYLNLSPQFFMLVDEPTHASAEVFNQNAIDYTFLPYAIAWEQSAQRDLLFDSDDVYIKHIFDSLLRGKTLERAQAYAQFVMNGIMSENECRIREDLEPVDGLDEPRRSANQDRGAEPRENEEPAPEPARRRQRQTEDEEAATPSRRFLLVAQANAARVVRRELETLRTKGAALASDPKKWTAWLEEFYGSHQAIVAEALQLPPLLSRQYVEVHRDALLANGLAAAEGWDKEAVAELTALAVGS